MRSFGGLDGGRDRDRTRDPQGVIISQTAGSSLQEDALRKRAPSEFLAPISATGRHVFC